MVSFKSILKLSFPIMVGSAVQNIINLTDTFFLGRVENEDLKVEYLGAIGLAGVFYLLITTIGYSFTKAGQIMIARRVGEDAKSDVGTITHAMGAFALLLSLVMFAFMKFFGASFFSMIVTDKGILKACIEYLDYRSYGVFFSYMGVVVLSLYTGIARTTVIIYNALVMGLANVVLNYGLVFGNLGMPEMGIGGAALASTISEFLAFMVFIIYLFFDKKMHQYAIFKMPQVDIKIITAQIKLSIPMILQTFASLGSWFIFFALIEQLGRNELAISNIIRTVYMLYMIPAWGFSSGINTIVSNLIGKNKLQEVWPAINKTAILCFAVTMVLCVFLLLFPEKILMIGTDKPELLEASKRLIWVLILILSLYSFSIIYFNGLVGTGATKEALYIQVSCVILYIIYVYVVVGYLKSSLEISWLAETIYMSSSMVVSIWYLKSNKWKKLSI
jgi:MATE family multidrug resistance protein